MTETTPEAGSTEALLAAALPNTPPALAQRLLMEAAHALGISGEPDDAGDDAAKMAAALGAMQAAAPRDALEAMLAAQMAAVHGAAMRALRRAEKCSGYPEIEALYARQAAQLMQLYLKQREALETRRGKAAEATETADPAAQADAAAVPGTIRVKKTNAGRPAERPPARCNGAAGPLCNGRRHTNGRAGPPS